MWICPVCNQLVPNPVNSKCPNGHGLFDERIMGSTIEQPARKAFVNAILFCLGVVAAINAINRFFPGKPFLGELIGFLPVVFIVIGVIALLRAFKWKRQGGPVIRLIPRAVGMGLACILTGAGLLALGSASCLLL